MFLDISNFLAYTHNPIIWDNMSINSRQKSITQIMREKSSDTTKQKKNPRVTNDNKFSKQIALASILSAGENTINVGKQEKKFSENYSGGNNGNLDFIINELG